MLDALGFTEDADGASWRRALSRPFDDADVVRVAAGAHAEAA
jgi:hypothetical protein